MFFESTCRKMKKLSMVVVVLSLASLTVLPEVARAQPHLGINLGYNATNEEMFIGGQGQFHITERPLMLNPRIEGYFIEGQTFLQFDGNVEYMIGEQYTQLFTPYVGAGLGVIYQSVDAVDDSSINLGFNVLGGAIFFPQSMIHPLVDARLTVAEDSYVTVLAGIIVTLPTR